jgi:hypothetical protein
MTKEQILAQAEVLRDRNEIYADESISALDHRKLFLQIAKLATKETRFPIIVSHTTSPSDLRIQLPCNKPDLEDLMDKLEKQYQGIGQSCYTMPEEYIVTGRLCAGVFRGDNNWHRSEIVQVFNEARQAKVAFIDYGGFDTVDFKLVKFLRRDFGQLPVQALKAKLANVKFRPRHSEENVKIVNYMLNRVANKTSLEASITGVVDGDVLCLEILDKTTQDNLGRPAGTCLSLNTRVIMDGYGESCDDSKQRGVLFEILLLTKLVRI